ncbi:amino acid transporter, partial [Geobacillus sp. MMMUD3]|nr:amino acid transporter [Geobacillus sp. MMMUD3]
MLTHLLTGLLAGWSLIIAVGPQNALVLRQGIRREHLGAVLTICIVADILLFGAGAVGIGAIVLLAPWALEVLRWLGVAYLLWFAFTSLRSARKAGGLKADAEAR